MEADVLLIYLIVGIVLIVIVFGLLVWAVISVLKGGSKGKGAPLPAGMRSAQGKRSDESRAPAFNLGTDLERSAPVTLRNKGIELLRICRDVSSGNVYVEMDGKQYRKVADIHDPQTGRLLLQTVADLNRFTRGVVPAVQTPGAAGGGAPQPHGASLLQPREPAEEPSTPRPGSLAQRGAALIDNAHAEKVEPGAVPPPPTSLLQRAYKMSETAEAKPKTQIRDRKPGEKPATARQAKPAGEPKVNLGSFWGRALTPVSTGSPVTGPRPLADELEDILVKLTDEMPDKPRHQIHFKTASDGRLVIEVDNTPYDDVNTIQDAEVKQTIRTVIGRWEKK